MSPLPRRGDVTCIRYWRIRDEKNAYSVLVRLKADSFDFISKILATVQPHTQPISGNETILCGISTIIVKFLYLATLYSLRKLNITDDVEKYNHRETIFLKVVIPSSPFVTLLIPDRYILNERLSESFMDLLAKLLQIGPSHQPTLEFVLASPIVIVFSTHLSFVEKMNNLLNAIRTINISLKEWNAEGPEVIKSGKRMMQALFSEGFDDTLEQMLKHDNDGINGIILVEDYSTPSLRTLLGCWENADCWCRRTDSGITSNHHEMVYSFGFIVLNAAVVDCHVVNRPLSKHFLASLNGTL
ncbi:hypothetical protein BLNAU_6666 [Blattamonas nauphoetae]|uniref:Uncharacterized protein n=1 Tax=Blattamonas nauphoetae TaxID=2049346 RepID=A0ABQ9Y3V8_9EUKA|nr:hypothetical protein BLNAU_6666 [Blattamonas nauphoetae]